jgi:hypothetical protein
MKFKIIDRSVGTQPFGRENTGYSRPTTRDRLDCQVQDVDSGPRPICVLSVDDHQMMITRLCAAAQRPTHHRRGG